MHTPLSKEICAMESAGENIFFSPACGFASLIRLLVFVRHLYLSTCESKNGHHKDVSNDVKLCAPNLLTILDSIVNAV